MDRIILAIFDQAQVADQARQALKSYLCAPGQMERFALSDLDGYASEAELLEHLRHFLGNGTETAESAEKYMDVLRAGSILLGIKASQDLAQHMTALLREAGATQVDTLAAAEAQAGWSGLVPPEDDRAFERPNREAEMESVGAQYSPPPAMTVRERRSGEDRRQVAGRRAGERDGARA